jgi:hypothetical protein
MKKIFFLLLLFLPFTLSGQVIGNSSVFKTHTSGGGGGGTTLTDGLIGYWKLDETSGTNANDEVGSSDLTHDGATVNQAGKLGRAVSYATNDFSGSIDGTFEIQAMTVSCWVNTTQTTNGAIVSNWEWENGGRGWEVAVGGEWNTEGRVVFFPSDGTNNVDDCFGAVINTGSWVHVAVTFDGSNVYFFVNGTRSGPYAWAHTITYNAANRLLFGARNAGATNNYTGLLDEVAIYNRAMAQSGIDSLYNAGSGTTYPFE